LPFVQELTAKLNALYPDKFVVRANKVDALQKYGTGEWRIGSFEVVREDTGEKLYSKLDKKIHFVNNESLFDRWLKESLEPSLKNDS